MAVGQISGPLLKANLLRNGVDLAFDTDLLYLDVNNRRIGIKTDTPTHELTVNGTTKTVDLNVTNQLDVGNITVTSDTISSTSGQINIIPFGTLPVVYNQILNIGDISVTGNTFSSISNNGDITFDPNGTGKVNILSNTEIGGDLHISGIITATGTISSENVSLTGGVSGDLLPTTTDFYKIGTPDKRWKDGYIQNLYADNVTTNNLIVNGIDLTLRVGNTIYVSTLGDNAHTGTHQNDPVGSLKYALSIATPGTTIYVYPGTYTEVFPMTVPAGVTIRGFGIRSVIIKPTLMSNDKDCFLLNGQTTIEDITIADFFYNSSTNTGYAFKFAAGFTVTSKSPYIRNVTVTTKGSVTSSGDPLGFDQGDAGRGAYLDGSVASPSSKEATGLFHAVTFITPGTDCIVLKNGVRVEWINSFTYYANRGIYALTDTTGFANQGKTAIRVSGVTGTFTAGQTITSYASNGTTPLATGTISSVDGTKIFISGYAPGFVAKTEINGKNVTAHGGAKLSTAQKKFGTASLALTSATSDYVTLESSPDFAFGTGDFTIEGYVFITSFGTPALMYDFRTATSQAVPAMGILANGTPYYYVNGTIVVQGSANQVLTGTWNHIAYSRVGTSGKLFLNGSQVGTTWTDTTNYIQAPLTIGANYGHTSFVDGYFDDFRVSKGIGKYSTTFVPSTSEFVRTADTVMLLHFNGANNSTVFEDDSFIVQDIRTLTGSAKYIEQADYTDFGAEVRSISSANIYGNYGVVGDGPGVVMYLVGQNFAYIGSGKDSSNLLSSVVQANEVVETNGAHIYYTSVDQKGDFRVGELFYVNQATGQVEFTSTNFNINSQQGITLSDGVNTTYIDSTELDLGDIKISGNTIQSLTTNLNLVSGGDQINLQNNVSVTGDVNIGGNLTIGGNLIIGDQPTDTISIVAGITSDLIPSGNYNLGSDNYRWNNLYTNTVVVDSVQITGNTVSSLLTNGVLNLAATGTGYIKFENIEVQDNEIRSINNDNLILKPNGTGVVYVDSTQALRLPSGTSSQRSGITGGIRYNTQINAFEGYDGTNWLVLNGVNDNDLNTRITAELTPGANDNVIRFYSNGTLVADIDSTRFRADRLDVGSLRLSGNTLSATTANTNIGLQTTGTGSVIVENFAFKNNTITNTVSGSVTEFIQTGDGYFKFGGTAGFVIPSGFDGEKPLIAEEGMIRYNKSSRRVEVYNGSQWINSAGEQTANVTVGEAEFIAIELILALG